MLPLSNLLTNNSLDWLSDAYPALVGLSLALGGSTLLAASDRLSSRCNSLASHLLQQLLLAGLSATIIAIVLFWENRSLSSIGWHSLHWESVAWGIAFALFLIFIYSPLMLRAMQQLKLPGFEGGLSKLSVLPIWYVAIAVITGGIAEEILYRGYATERLSELTGSYWTGSVLALIAFGLAHVPMWGWGAALTTVISGTLLTIFYLWLGDLLPCIIAHIITDSVGLMIFPAVKTQKSDAPERSV